MTTQTITLPREVVEQLVQSLGHLLTMNEISPTEAPEFHEAVATGRAALTEQVQPAQGEQDGRDEFLSKRLGRVAKLAGVHMPTTMTHEQIADVAGTILGEIAFKLEALLQSNAEREPLTDEQCRAKFEAWYSSAPDADAEPERTYELTDESMSELTKECIWMGWQAAHGIPKGQQ